MRRRVKMQLTEAGIRQALGIPDDVEIVAYEVHVDPPEVYVILSHEDFDEVPTGAESPFARVYVTKSLEIR